MPSPSPDDPKPQREDPRGPETPAEMRDAGLFGDVISRYTREQAIEDGVLMDVSEAAREAGFRIPVALTRAAWAEYVEVPEGVIAQDEAGRLWDVLWMARDAIGRFKATARSCSSNSTSGTTTARASRRS
jgi:hypothetical protein